jgi:hypothetical protein
LIQMFDSTTVRAHASAAGAKVATKSGTWPIPGRVVEHLRSARLRPDSFVLG